MKPSQSGGVVQIFFVISRDSNVVETKPVSDLYVLTAWITFENGWVGVNVSVRGLRGTLKAHSAHEQRRKDRLIEDLLHDHGENLRAENVCHRETDSDGYKESYQKQRTRRLGTIITTHVPSMALLIPISFSVS